MIVLPIVGIILLAIPFFVSQEALVHGPERAQLYFQDPPSAIPVGQTETLQLRVKTLARAANAVGVSIRYNPNILDIVSMTTAQSFCTFYTENSFDTIKGEIDVDCGVPNPGFSGDSVLLVLQVRGKNLGSTPFTFASIGPSGTSVLANDGKATEMLTRLPKFTLSVTQSL
jgi:hypothetical protein